MIKKGRLFEFTAFDALKPLGGIINNLKLGLE